MISGLVKCLAPIFAIHSPPFVQALRNNALICWGPSVEGQSAVHIGDRLLYNSHRSKSNSVAFEQSSGLTLLVASLQSALNDCNALEAPQEVRITSATHRMLDPARVGKPSIFKPVSKATEVRTTAPKASGKHKKRSRNQKNKTCPKRCFCNPFHKGTWC